MDKLNFDREKIYDLEFSLDFKGYAPQEVDSVLDKIINDYTVFLNQVEKLETEITDLNLKLAQKEALIIELEGKLKVLSELPVEQNINQVDLMKRIARLEALVYNQGE